MCRTPSGSERKRKRLGVSDGDNGKCRLVILCCMHALSAVSDLAKKCIVHWNF